MHAGLDKRPVGRIDSAMEQKRRKKQAAFNPVSPIVLVLVVVLVGVELVFQAAEHGLIGGPLAEGWRIDMMRHFGFHKAVFDHLVLKPAQTGFLMCVAC